MTTVQITLPDQLAQEAQRAGLLSSDRLERMLRELLKAQAVDELFEAMDWMAATEPTEAMSAEEIADEIRQMRAERRAQQPT